MKISVGDRNVKVNNDVFGRVLMHFGYSVLGYCKYLTYLLFRKSWYFRL